MEYLVLVVGGGSLGAHVLGNLGLTNSGDTFSVRAMGIHLLQTPMDCCRTVLTTLGYRGPSIVDGTFAVCRTFFPLTVPVARIPRDRSVQEWM